MFDIGFSELVVIGLAALVVIGPERLPRVARTVGLLLGRAQRYVQDIKTEIHREMQLDEIRQLEANMKDSFHTLEDSVRAEIDAAKSVFADGASEALAKETPPATNETETAQEENAASNGIPDVAETTPALTRAAPEILPDPPQPDPSRV
jgi:sec-independent protein translocase protein TatB